MAGLWIIMPTLTFPCGGQGTSLYFHMGSVVIVIRIPLLVSLTGTPVAENLSGPGRKTKQK